MATDGQVELPVAAACLRHCGERGSGTPCRSYLYSADGGHPAPFLCLPRPSASLAATPRSPSSHAGRHERHADGEWGSCVCVCVGWVRQRYRACRIAPGRRSNYASPCRRKSSKMTFPNPDPYPRRPIHLSIELDQHRGRFGGFSGAEAASMLPSPVLELVKAPQRIVVAISVSVRISSKAW